MLFSERDGPEGDQRDQERRISLRLGLLSGLLIGLALALGVWASDAIFLSSSHVQLAAPSLLLGTAALVLLGALAGWLAAWIGRAWASALIWLGAGFLMMQVIGHMPYEGRTMTVWLADRRSWGLAVYPYSEAAGVGVFMAGFFVVLLLTLLGFLQPYRLEGIGSETDARGRPEALGWFRLLLPLPLVVAVGLIADGMVNKPLRVAPQLVHEAIRTGRTYEGNLFTLSLERDVNYNAISGVRDQMSEEYTLSIGSVDLGVSDTIFVVADFDNGAWIACRVVAEQLSFCFDASLPYKQGLPALIMSGSTPEDCPLCKISADEEQKAWLQSRGEMFEELPVATRLAQWGSYVLVRVEASDGGYVLECLLEGLSPVRLQRCWEVKSREEPSSGGTIPSGDQGLAGVQAEGGKGSAASGTATGPGSVAEFGPGAQVSFEAARLESGMWDPSDRLGPPPLSDPPTQVELGYYAYYLSCMVCHGDQGQGLEAWRTVLPVEDQNCWQSRCHAANHPPDGFQLPRYAPPLIGPGTLARFQTAADLYAYIEGAMPWQAPGILAGEEYWQITAFLAQAHGTEPGREPLDLARAATLVLHAGTPDSAP